MFVRDLKTYNGFVFSFVFFMIMFLLSGAAEEKKVIHKTLDLNVKLVNKQVFIYIAYFPYLNSCYTISIVPLKSVCASSLFVFRSDFRRCLFAV